MTTEELRDRQNLSGEGSPMTDLDPAAIMAAHADHGADGCYDGSGLHSMGHCLPYRLAADLAAERDKVRRVWEHLASFPADFPHYRDDLIPLMYCCDEHGGKCCTAYYCCRRCAALAGEGGKAEQPGEPTGHGLVSSSYSSTVRNGSDLLQQVTYTDFADGGIGGQPQPEVRDVIADGWLGVIQ